MRFQFIESNKLTYGVDEMCECLEVSRSGYYAWRGRGPSERSLQDEGLKERIDALHKKSKRRYGYRPIYHHLRDEERDCGRDRTLRLMKEMGIEGMQKKGFKPLGTDSAHNFGYSPNLLRELGHPDRCDHVWVADTTYLRTEDGWGYLATVMDLFSRRIIGWCVSDHNDASLCCKALQAAVLTRGGQLPEGLIHHSDRGSTYASYDYQDMLESYDIRQSMSAKGNCYDNAAMESFFGRFKITSVGDITFADLEHARSAVFEYIETFYNRFRKHSSLGYKSPFQFEVESSQRPAHAASA
jgi:transposase InsO family protein